MRQWVTLFFLPWAVRHFNRVAFTASSSTSRGRAVTRSGATQAGGHTVQGIVVVARLPWWPGSKDTVDGLIPQLDGKQWPCGEYFTKISFKHREAESGFLFVLCSGAPTDCVFYEYERNQINRNRTAKNTKHTKIKSIFIRKSVNE